MPQTDYIPRNDKEFEQFFRNITDYVIDNAARWGHIKQTDVDTLELQFSDWNTAYEKTLVPHIPQLTAEKNRVRLSTERGRTVYIALSWQNERGLIGQWSEIQSAVIP